MRVLKALALIVLVALLVPYVLAPFYRFGHPVSTLMLWRQATGAPMTRQWIDLPAMSPYLPRSVVGAEDAHFCKHHGIDLGAMREMLRNAQAGGDIRGASTITQQVARNLFLWQEPLGVIRKVLEIPLALWIDAVLPKRRILELYLNVAEFGPSGQFGAEAGSAFAFGHSAARLSPREAALLASTLPNPRTRSARTPGPGLRRLAGVYTARAEAVATCWDEKRPE